MRGPCGEPAKDRSTELRHSHTDAQQYRKSYTRSKGEHRSPPLCTRCALNRWCCCCSCCYTPIRFNVMPQSTFGRANCHFVPNGKQYAIQQRYTRTAHHPEGHVNVECFLPCKLFVPFAQSTTVAVPPVCYELYTPHSLLRRQNCGPRLDQHSVCEMRHQ